jgi:hypothetical protein
MILAALSRDKVYLFFIARAGWDRLAAHLPVSSWGEKIKPAVNR